MIAKLVIFGTILAIVAIVIVVVIVAAHRKSVRGKPAGDDASVVLSGVVFSDASSCADSSSGSDGGGGCDGGGAS